MYVTRWQMQINLHTLQIVLQKLLSVDLIGDTRRLV